MPAHATPGAVPGYVDYGLYHGAKLKVDIEDRRFVFSIYQSISIEKTVTTGFP
jgi:hypothetical protein